MLRRAPRESDVSSLQPLPPRPTASLRELALVALVAGVWTAWLLRDALFGGALALVGAGEGEFAHAAARFVARSWAAGDAPWWNPHVGAGAPGLGNPLLGVLDPQSLPLVLAQRLGGLEALSATMSWLAWARVVAAAVGAYALARRIALAPAGAWIAALSFAGAGYLALSALEAGGRVAWLAPWILLALERLRATGGRRGAVGLALSVALALGAGQLETALFVLALALAWAVHVLREHAHAGRNALLALVCGAALAAPVLAPALSYLARSTLLATRAAQERGLDLLDVGLLALLAGALWRARELGARLVDDGAREQRFAVGVAVAFALLALLVAALAPWPDSARRLLLFDLFGSPGDPQGYWGEGRFADAARGWIAPFALTLALAGLLAPGLGPVRVAGVLRWSGALGLVLSCGAPAAAQFAAQLPFVELCDPRHVGAAASLVLALLAGAAFEHASAWARASAAASVALLAGALVFVSASRESAAPPLAELDGGDGLVALVRKPEPLLARGALAFEGWIHPELAVESAAVRVSRAGEPAPDAHALPLPLELSTSAPRAADLELAPAGALWFRAPHLNAADLAEGSWEFALVLRGADGRVLSERVLCAATVDRPRRTSLASLVLVFASAFAALWLRPTQRVAAPLAVALVMAASSWFQHELHASRPLGQLFGAPERCEAIAAAAGEGRVMCDFGIVSPHAALGLGWRALEARDGLGLAEFDALRPAVLAPGEHPALGFAASGFDERTSLAQRFDVRLLAQRGERRRSGAATTSVDGVQLHRLDSLGPARLVAELLPAELARKALREFDATQQAFISGDIAWGPRQPFRSGAVELRERGNHSIELRAQLDGDALLVVGEQSAPGWSARVDGREALLLEADELFLAVPLGAGEHTLEFRYSPPLLRVGVFLALLGAAGLALLAFRARAATAA